MALWAMSVSARVVGDRSEATRGVLTTRNMATEGRRAAALDRAHHLELRMTEVAPVGVTPRGAVIAEIGRAHV